MSNYAILINTCDKFEECWNPFFKLFKEFWPDFAGTIYLNTEYKDFSYPGLHIKAVQGCLRNEFPKTERATWSQCLKWALAYIEEDLVLYMQEDYFLKGRVQNEWVKNYVELMKGNSTIDCIHLTDQAVENTGPSEFKNLYNVKIKQRYRLCCQAAIWKKEVLDYYLRSHESAWEFEEFGSKRAAWESHKFYVVDPNWIKIGVNEIIPYVFTGIIGGKWKEEVVPLFESFDIKVDFSNRGFHESRRPTTIKEKIDNRIKKIPIQFKHFLERISRKK
ncbi:hypothetical protein [Maribacter luteus]|uniref:Glycosyltransferase n=1 Tax=Maribacter luteus TaxID=2594478 RepID=A0A6I2MI05_9FLAO|nr:hypothetical protein [Maribacter luteus]MRX63338.1 hypothetical protein [Maribacter luteus]